MHVFHTTCLGFLFEIVHIIGPTKENRFVSERRVSTPIPDKKVQPLKVHTRDPEIEKSTKREPCTDFSATKSLPVAVSGRILF